MCVCVCVCVCVVCVCVLRVCVCVCVCVCVFGIDAQLVGSWEEDIAGMFPDLTPTNTNVPYDFDRILSHSRYSHTNITCALHLSLDTLTGTQMSRVLYTFHWTPHWNTNITCALHLSLDTLTGTQTSRVIYTFHWTPSSAHKRHV